MNINCTHDCLYQKSGKCTYTCIKEYTNTSAGDEIRTAANSDCSYYSPIL